MLTSLRCPDWQLTGRPEHVKTSRISAAFVAAVGVMVTPAAASAVPGSEGSLVALSAPGTVSIHPGETVPVAIGVGNNTNIMIVSGLVMQVTVTGDLDLPKTLGNCWYYAHGATEGAWCLLPGRVDSGSVHQATPFTVSAARNARADRVGDVVVSWEFAAQDDDLATMRDAAVRSAGPGATVVRGAAGSIKLVDTTTLTRAAGSPTGSVPLRLDTPPTVPASPDDDDDETTVEPPPAASIPHPATTLPADPATHPPVASYTRVTAQPAFVAESSPAAAPPASDEQLAQTDSAMSFGAVFGTGCFMLAAGLLATQVFVRRRNKFVA